MKQIGNWVFGSFFRTIGRLLVFILLGIVIANLIDFGSIKDNFRITDLFFDKVDALSFSTDVKQVSSGWIDISNINNTNEWTNTYGGYYSTIQAGGRNMQNRGMYFKTPLDVTQYDYIAIPFAYSVPTRTQYSNWNNDYACEEWYNYVDSLGHSRITCQSWTNNDYQTIENNDHELPITSFYFNITYEDGNWNSCDFSDGMIFCPTIHKKISYISVNYIFWSLDNTASYSSIFIGGGFRVYNYNDARTAIESQTQQQQQQHQEMMDSNTTQAESEATEFFNDFQVQDHGGLSGIITAPLSTIQGLLNNTCTNLVLPLPFVNENLTLPCMSSIYTQHFGAFFSIYQTIILAIISYRCLRSLFYDVRGFINPDDDRIEVMDL